MLPSRVRTLDLLERGKPSNCWGENIDQPLISRMERMIAGGFNLNRDSGGFSGRKSSDFEKLDRDGNRSGVPGF
jgi:hypothetical protein